VLLLRDTPDNGGLEVLMTRRSGTASFAPGAYVFPGGGIDALDASPETHAAADRRPAQGDLHLTQAIAAIRESFEELGVLLARHTDGPRKGLMADAHDIAAIDRHQPFAAQCRPAACAWRPTACTCWPTGRVTATCRGALRCPFSWPACPRARSPWPTKPSSSSPCGCARPMRWRGTRRASSS
jgi:8-oxo-dGTP pyrophosphatase MutT (NUDIX family)